MSVKNVKVVKGTAKTVVDAKSSKEGEMPGSDVVVLDDKTAPVSENKSSDKEVKSKEDLSDVVAFKSLTANKLSLRSKGLLSYQVGFISEIDQLFIRLQANETGGYFSKEWVPANEVATCLLVVAKGEADAKSNVKSNSSSFSAAVLKPCFKSKSQNNAGFLAAVLKAEGIVSQVKDKANLLSFDQGVFDAWVVSHKELAKQVGNSGAVIDADSGTKSK